MLRLRRGLQKLSSPRCMSETRGNLRITRSGVGGVLVMPQPLLPRLLCR